MYSTNEWANSHSTHQFLCLFQIFKCPHKDFRQSDGPDIQTTSGSVNHQDFRGYGILTMLTAKDQSISERLFHFFNFPKKQQKHLMNFCPIESKKWLNEKDKALNNVSNSP